MDLLPSPKLFLSRPTEKCNNKLLYLHIYKNILTLDAQSKFIPNAASVSSTRELSLHFTA